MRQAFADDGVSFVDGRAEEVKKVASGILVQTSSGQNVEGDVLLIASGRKPKGLEALNLEAAGVKYDVGKGIHVNGKLQSSAAHIYAVGDCLGGLQFTHLAGFQGGLAAFNAFVLPFGGVHVNPPNSSCPRCTFTHPEVASVGLTEAEARELHGDAIQCSVRQSVDIDRAVCEGDTRGFIKIIHRPATAFGGGKILGATVVSNVAGELASELGLAIAAGTPLQKLGTTMHAYPTFSFGLFQLAGEFASSWTRNLCPVRCLNRCCARRLRGSP